MAAGKPGPARKPHLQAVKEGEKRAKSRPDPILLPPEAPAEPRWTELVPLPKPDGMFTKAGALRIRKRAAYLWALWVSILDPQGVLARVDETTLQEAALTIAELEEIRRMILTRPEMQPRWFGRAAHLEQAYYRYIPQLGLSPASRLEAREGGRLDSDFDDI
jgi:hypothetical protein